MMFALVSCSSPTDLTAAGKQDSTEGLVAQPTPEEVATADTPAPAESTVALDVEGAAPAGLAPAPPAAIESTEEVPVDVFAPRPLAGRIIAIDPGHNGGNFSAPTQINRPVDAGGFSKLCNTTGTATDDGYRESTFNLEVARLLSSLLEDVGATLPMTRSDDEGVGPCIDVRGTFGAAVDADLLVSIHADGASAGDRGFQVIHPHTDGVTHPEIVGPLAELAAAVRDALLTVPLQPSTYAGRNGLIARGDLATLNLSEVPAVILEAGNLRDEQDAAVLRDPTDQAALAAALRDAVMTFLGGQG